MEFSHRLLLFIALLLPLVRGADPIYLLCEQNITGNSALQGLFNRAINTLIASTPPSGYTTTTLDGFYGLGRCLDGISSQDCSDCIVSAGKTLRERCPISYKARIWLELCSIRVSTDNFIGTIDTSDLKGWGSAKRAANPAVFNSIVWGLMDQVKASAAAAGKKFGMGAVSLNGGSTTIYGMAYCTQDLQKNQCMQCLDKLTGMMRSQCDGRLGCNLICSSCGQRYEDYRFLKQNIASTSTPTIA